VLRTRLATAAIGLPGIWLLVEFLPDALFATFIAIVVAIALYEYFTMALGEHPLERAVGMLWGLIVAAGVISRRPELWGAGLGAAVIGGLALSLRRPADLAGAINRLGLMLLGVLYVGFFTPHIVVLRGEPQGWRWVLFTVYVAMGSDTGGYFAGRAWGRHKLAPGISPGKTVEGSIGAVGGAIVIAVLCRLIFFRTLPLSHALGCAVAISALAQLGDLCESALKRAFGAKDSGWIIPGHGGILDRLDSLLFPFVFAAYFAAIARG
jgi:phosphatidate cytidylyltransferase